MKLRDYQRTLVDQVRAEYASGARTVLLMVPTGGGKTAMASEVLRLSVAKRKRAIFLAHLDTLIEDTHARLTAAGVPCGFVQAGRVASPEAPVQVASTMTLHRRETRPPADLVIVDECHRAAAESVLGILQAYPTAKILGLTATPARSDGKALGDVFERLVQGPGTRELTKRGYLVPCDVIAPPEYLDSGLAQDPVDAWFAHTPGQRTLVFASNVGHAEDVTRRFIERGIVAELITGETPRAERQGVRERMTTGDLRVLVSVGCFIEGFDLPAVEAIVLARGFADSCGAYLQAIGRGLRPSPGTGKTRCTVIDLRGAVNILGLPDEERRWSLTGAPVVRTETVDALRRCKDCLAVFRPAEKCPRCGASTFTATKLPRVLNQAERMVLFNEIPLEQREASYFRQMVRIGHERRRMSRDGAERWARSEFEKKWGHPWVEKRAAA
jgi:DNA repair protein RadD